MHTLTPVCATFDMKLRRMLTPVCASLGPSICVGHLASAAVTFFGRFQFSQRLSLGDPVLREILSSSAMPGLPTSAAAYCFAGIWDGAEISQVQRNTVLRIVLMPVFLASSGGPFLSRI